MIRNTILTIGMLTAIMAAPAAAQGNKSEAVAVQTGGFSYATISVRDLERSKRFYRELLGLKIAFDRIHDSPLAIVMNKSGSQTSREFSLLLQQVTAGASRGPVAPSSDYAGPIGIWVTDIEDYLTRAKAAGVPVVRGLNDPGGAAPRTIVLRDPDGLIVELLETRVP